MIQRVLFVCLGNICRSPAAQGVFRTMAPDIEADSAATVSWHVGNAPYAPVQAAMKARGMDISDIRGRQITSDDFNKFDLIVAMDRENLAAVEELRPVGCQTPVHLLTSYLAGFEGECVPDPYYTRDFDGCLDLIEEATDALQAHLAS